MALIVNSRVEIPFRGILDSNPSVNLKGTDLEIYVDGVLWNTGQDVTKDNQYLTITFDAVYLQTQRNIIFKTASGNATRRFAIKTQVYAIDDVVIVEYDPAVDAVPKLGTYQTAPITVNSGPISVGGVPLTVTSQCITPIPQPNGTILYYDSCQGVFVTNLPTTNN